VRCTAGASFMSGEPATATSTPGHVKRWTTGGRGVLLRSVVSVLAGFLVFAGFPPRQLWFLAPIGIALLVLVLTGAGGPAPRLRAGFGYGYLAGLGFLVPLLPWIGVFVGA